MQQFPALFPHTQCSTGHLNYTFYLCVRASILQLLHLPFTYDDARFSDCCQTNHCQYRYVIICYRTEIGGILMLIETLLAKINIKFNFSFNVCINYVNRTK